MFATRARVAEQYLFGSGVEFGALHASLTVPEWVTVKYADMVPAEKLRAWFPDLKGIRAPDFVTDLESMRGIDDASMDFVIANHVLEHVEDPLRALASLSRVLRPSGIAFIALPDKRFTFDKDRAITPLEHLIRDYEQGPDCSIAEHYDEWARCIDGLSGDAHKQKCADMLRDRTNIHFHVWDYPAMLEMFANVARTPDFGLEVEMSMQNGVEVIWILRKSTSADKEAKQATAARAASSAAGSNEAPCPVCGDRMGHRVFTHATSGCDVFRCEQCTATFIWPPVEQDFNRMAVSAIPLQASDAGKETAEFWLSHIRQEGRKAILNPGEKPRILEVGCGPGHLLTHFRANEWEVRGVDPWAAAAALGRNRHQIPIETARVEDATIEPSSQDVVISLDVLQFVGEPREFLDACRKALKPGGMIFLTVPNFGCAESRRDGWNWQFFLPQCHVTYFTEASLRQLLGKAGFFRIKITPFGGSDGDTLLRVAARRPAVSALTWADISEAVTDDDLPRLDRQSVDDASLSPEQRSWRENGYVIAKRLIPDDLVDRYCAVRIKQPLDTGWTSASPYHEVPEIRDLCLYKPLTDLIESLIGEPMGLHLNLTGWTSTERDWHQDDYLNPPTVNGHYAAVWTALDAIKPDAGPFEFVPGSHRWPIIRQAKILDLLGYEDPSERYWTLESERLLTPFFDHEIKRCGAKIERFLGGKGDVLIWHARLLHRGSLPERAGAERRSMIAHYSAIRYRPDMPHVYRHPGGGFYFDLNDPAWHPRQLVGGIVLGLRALARSLGRADRPGSN